MQHKSIELKCILNVEPWRRFALSECFKFKFKCFDKWCDYSLGLTISGQEQ